MNRKIHVLVATGRYAEVNGIYRGVCRTAFETDEAARAEVPAFTARCEEPEHERIFTIVSGSVEVSVRTLDLVDTAPDACDDVLFLLLGEGTSAVFDGPFHAIHRRIFNERRAAERAAPAFAEACFAEAPGSIDRASRDRFNVRILELRLCSKDLMPHTDQ